MTEVEEGGVTEGTKSESETIGYVQSEEEEEGEVVPEKVRIQGEASSEVSRRKTRSGGLAKRSEWLAQNVMISSVEEGKPEEEA